MRRLGLVLVVLIATSGFAQQKPIPSEDHAILIVRHNMGPYSTPDGEDQLHTPEPLFTSGGFCGVIYSDGFFQVQPREAAPFGQRWILEGHVASNRLAELRRLLASRGFRDLVSDDRYSAGFSHRGSEFFDTRIFRRDGTQRFRWVSAGSSRSLPEPAKHLLDWFNSQAWNQVGERYLSRQPLCPYTLEPADAGTQMAER